ncbi:YggT family protein [Alloscardovia theropitheci]|uniref:YggT family protein n=1 Tax=Alloscardovia theropitheci TaxID=2496842 RepID=A0A4V2MTV9_9BIFI|nr:YggT family protein [Alloscardovia theropitheci]TCD53999.1 YggT family protein [Alloscardovia theropitheci]
MTFFVVLAIVRLILLWVLNAYMSILFIRLILDWVAFLTRWQPRGIVYTLINAVYVLTDPPLNFLRKYIRPVPIGRIYFDLSFIVLWLVLGLLIRIVM